MSANPSTFRRAHVRAVSQVSLSIPSTDVADSFEKIRFATLDWMAYRAGKPLPKDAWSGAAFDLQDIGAQRTIATSLKSPPYWAARLDDADKEVAQRIWVTEIGIAQNGSNEVLFGCRLYCVALGESPPFAYTIPAFVRRVAQRFPAFVDGRPVIGKAWDISDRREVNKLVSVLVDRSRRLPVTVVSEGVSGKFPIDADSLAIRVLGAGHVVRLGNAASFALSDALGKEFSVFDGAVRTYRRNFDPDADEPGLHPLALLESIECWSEGGASGFADFIVNRTIQQSVMRRDLEKELPSFATIQTIAHREALSLARQKGKSDGELLQLALDEVVQVEKRAEEEKRTLSGLLDEAEDERDRATEGAVASRAEAANLRARVAHLEHALRNHSAEPTESLPESLEELEEWARRNLAGSVVIMNRALRAAKKSEFEDTKLVFDALLMLRDAYVPMRRNGEEGSRETYTARLNELGLEESASFAGGRAGEQGDEYFVEYAGRRRELDRHLKGSNSRDTRFGFRLYFFWDEESRQAVIGWLPSHLTTRVS